MKTLFTSVLLLTSINSFAISGACRGEHEGQEILINGYGESDDPRDATARLSVDGREVAIFEGRDARINYIFQSARVSNAQGDTLEGKVVSLTDKTGLITKLSVPGYGIEYRNIPVSCWMDQ